MAGTVSGHHPFGWVTVAYGWDQHSVGPGQSTYELTPPLQAADLLAARFDSTSGVAGIVADRLIVRRNQAYEPGAAIPLLDFNSVEAFAPHQMTVSTTAGFGWVQTAYYSRGTGMYLGSRSVGTPGAADAPRTATAAAVPLDRLAEGDIHRLDVHADGRAAHLFFRIPSDRALSLGPPAEQLQVSTVAASPWRFRVTLPSQPDYGARAWINLWQTRANGTTTSVVFDATREFFGRTPGTWSFTLPDLTGLAGFDAAATFNSEPFYWSLEVTGARFGIELANAVEGESYRKASSHAAAPWPVP